MREDNHYLGYPIEHIVYETKTRRRMLGGIVLLGALCLVFSIGYVFDWPGSDDFWDYAPFIAVAFVFFTAFIAMPSLRNAHRPKILPYFEKGQESPEGSTYASGEALARNCRYLDDIAIERDIEPLAKFGFADDFPYPWRKIEWFEAERGLKSISFLIAFLRDNPEAIPEPDEVFSDLTKIEFRLKDASRRNIPFRFILHYANATNQMEQDQRQGTYF
jgi:hypothetical protein